MLFRPPPRQSWGACLRFDVTIIINADCQNFMSWEIVMPKALASFSIMFKDGEDGVLPSKR